MMKSFSVYYARSRRSLVVARAELLALSARVNTRKRWPTTFSDAIAKSHERHSMARIGPTVTKHLRTGWDQAGNAPLLTVVDPVTLVSVTFPDLTMADEDLNENLIMPRALSVHLTQGLRPARFGATETKGVAMAVVSFLTNMGGCLSGVERFRRLVTGSSG